MASEDIRYHDKIDRDVIQVNKDSLLQILRRSKDYHTSGSYMEFVNLSLVLFSGAFLTEKFFDFGPVSGATIRAVFITLGIVTASAAVRRVWTRHNIKDEYEPDTIVALLLKDTIVLEPQKLLPAPPVVGQLKKKARALSSRTGSQDSVQPKQKL